MRASFVDMDQEQNTPSLGARFVFHIDLKYKTRPHRKYVITLLGACFVFEVNMRNKTRPHWRKCYFNSMECISIDLDVVEV